MTGKREEKDNFPNTDAKFNHYKTFKLFFIGFSVDGPAESIMTLKQEMIYFMNSSAMCE